jgi:hypothetical protein
MTALTESDVLEIWLVLELLAGADEADRKQLTERAYDLFYRLRAEGKIERLRPR